jgi:hypothetical protein
MKEGWNVEEGRKEGKNDLVHATRENRLVVMMERKDVRKRDRRQEEGDGGLAGAWDRDRKDRFQADELSRCSFCHTILLRQRRQ